MTEKLLQVRVADHVKDTCDELFATRGISTQNAIRMLLTQVANSGKTPFDNLFSPNQK